jgi:hypothetical protein
MDLTQRQTRRRMVDHLPALPNQEQRSPAGRWQYTGSVLQGTDSFGRRSTWLSRVRASHTSHRVGRISVRGTGRHGLYAA